MLIPSLAGAATPRAELTLKLSRMNAELESKGTVDDPVSSQLGWCQDRIVSFGSRLEEYPQATLGDMHRAALRVRQRTLTATGLLAVGTVAGVAACVAKAAENSIHFPLALTVTAGLAIAAARTGLEAGEAGRTARELEQWGAAFAKTKID